MSGSVFALGQDPPHCRVGRVRLLEGVMQTFEAAARKWCANKIGELDIIGGLRKCHSDGQFCSRVVVGPSGPHDEARLSLPSEWCEACQANLPALESLRALRAARGGLARAMYQAYRRDEG